MSKFPWDYHTDLSEERLKVIGGLIVEARHGALDLYDEELGDEPWCLGCRSYSWTRHRIIEAAESSEYPWLAIEDSSMRFKIRVGDVPMRFYRGEPENPTARTLQQTFDELRQMTLPFVNDGRPMPELWRLAVETDLTGEVEAITCAGLTYGGTLICSWPIPLMEFSPQIHEVDGAQDPGVDLQSPKVSSRQRPRLVVVKSNNDNDE